MSEKKEKVAKKRQKRELSPFGKKCKAAGVKYMDLFKHCDVSPYLAYSWFVGKSLPNLSSLKRVIPYLKSKGIEVELSDFITE